MSLAFLTLASLLQGCSNTEYATKEDLARLEGRLQALEQRGGSGSPQQGGGMGGQGMGMGGGQGMGMGGQGMGMGGQGMGMGGGQGMGMGGPGMGQGMGGQGMGGQGQGVGAGGGEEVVEGEAPAELQEMEKALAAGMDAMNAGEVDDAKTRFTEVTTNYPDAKGAETAKQLLAELAIIGAKAPVLSVSKWVQGKGGLNDGKATLLVFFDPDHKNADSAITRIQTLATTKKSAGLNVVGLAHTTKAEAAVKEWLTARGVSFAVGIDKGGATADAYKRSAPISSVLVSGGEVVWTGNASRLGDDVLAKYL